MSRYVFVANLPRVIRKDEIFQVFRGYGRPHVLSVESGRAFLEFGTLKDAADAVKDLHRTYWFGESLIVDFARKSMGPNTQRPIRLRAERMSLDTGSGRVNPCRVQVSGLNEDTSLRDLKSWGEQSGEVTYAGMERSRPGKGFLDYTTVPKARLAITTLNGLYLKGNKITVYSESIDENNVSLRRRNEPQRTQDSRSSPMARRSRSPPRRCHSRSRSRGYRNSRGATRSRSPERSYTRSRSSDSQSPMRGRSDNESTGHYGRRRESRTTYRTTPPSSPPHESKFSPLAVQEKQTTPIHSDPIVKSPSSLRSGGSQSRSPTSPDPSR